MKPTPVALRGGLSDCAGHGGRTVAARLLPVAGARTVPVVEPSSRGWSMLPRQRRPGEGLGARGRHMPGAVQTGVTNDAAQEKKPLRVGGDRSTESKRRWNESMQLSLVDVSLMFEDDPFSFLPASHAGTAKQ
jgi:hypothetical protein